jgi:hypothetical protein
MSVYARLFFSALFLFVLSPAAHAAWTTFTALDTSKTALSDPSCASAGAGKAVCAIRDQNSKLAVSVYDGSAWSTWKEFPNVIASAPSCTDRAAGEVICAARSPTGRLLYTIYSAATWTTPALGPVATFVSDPSCARLSATKILCATRSTAGALQAATYTTKWTAFKNLGGTTTSAPSCASDSAGGAICAIRSTTGTVLVNRLSAGVWGGLLDLGGAVIGNPTCARYGLSQQVICTYNYYGYYTYSNRFLGGLWQVGSWAGWVGAGGNIVNNVSCALVTNGQIACAANSMSDSGMYPNIYSGTWTSWTPKVGGVNVGSPACASLGSSKVLCVVVGTDSHLSSTIGP